MTARQAFIQKHASDVIAATNGTGIFPSVKMAQMLIESTGKDSKGNWLPGYGITARLANNYFGIKADKSWKGEKKAFSTPKDGKPVNYFRVYNNVRDSIADHTLFLKRNSRYEKNGVFSAATPEAQAWALQKAGYAEGRDGKGAGYADGIIKMIALYNLKELDKKAGLKQSTSTDNTGLIVGGSILATVALLAALN